MPAGLVQGCDVPAGVVQGGALCKVVHCNAMCRGCALCRVVMCQQGATHPLSLALLGPKVNIEGSCQCSILKEQLVLYCHSRVKMIYKKTLLHKTQQCHIESSNWSSCSSGNCRQLLWEILSNKEKICRQHQLNPELWIQSGEKQNQKMNLVIPKLL